MVQPDSVKRYVGESPQLAAILAQVERLRTAGLAPGQRPPIFLSGETGTGKGHLALVIHEMLGGGPFVEVDCASAPADPDGREALFEAARGGTLMLDEVTGLGAGLQAAFLGLIEARARAIGVQIVASTNRDLDRAVADGAFRADLLHRLRGLCFGLPPLRERGDDVLQIARHLCAELAKLYGRDGLRLDEDAEALLRSHPWPGNVRELRSVIERAVLATTEDTLGRELLEQVLSPLAPRGGVELPENGLDLATLERELIERALRRTDGNRTQAARLLGLSRYSLRHRMKKWGLG